MDTETVCKEMERLLNEKSIETLMNLYFKNDSAPEAFECLNMVARQGNNMARMMLNIGDVELEIGKYYLGEGKRKEAFEWIQKAANIGQLLESLEFMMHMCERGIGTAKNADQAEVWRIKVLQRIHCLYPFWLQRGEVTVSEPEVIMTHMSKAEDIFKALLVAGNKKQPKSSRGKNAPAKSPAEKLSENVQGKNQFSSITDAAGKQQGQGTCGKQQVQEKTPILMSPPHVAQAKSQDEANARANSNNNISKEMLCAILVCICIGVCILLPIIMKKERSGNESGISAPRAQQPMSVPINPIEEKQESEVPSPTPAPVGPSLAENSQETTGVEQGREQRLNEILGELTPLQVGAELKGEAVAKQISEGFQGRLIESCEMPDSIETIPINCFEACALLKRVKLSDNLTAIPEGAFKNWGL